MKTTEVVLQYYAMLKNKFKHPLFRNSVFGSGGFVFISLVGLVITPFLVSNFGFEQYGIYILIISIVGYYGIFDFGLGQGLIKFVSEYNSTDSKEQLNDAVNSVFTIQLMIGLVLSTTIFLFSENIIALLNVTDIFYQDAVSALRIASVGFFFSMLASTYSAAMKGLELYGGVTTIDSGSNLTLNLLLLVVLMMGYGIKEAVWVNVSIAVTQLIAYAILFKRNKLSYTFGLGFNIAIIKKFLSFTLYLFLSRISNIFATYVVRFVISFFLGPAAVTFYVVPAKLLGAIGGVLSAAANAIFPYTSRLAALGKTEEIKRSFIKSNLIFAAVSLPISCVVIFFSEPIMTLWMGAEFANKSWLILSIICLSGTVGSFTAIPNLVLLGLGISRLIGFFSAITIVSYLIFIPLLTKYFGLIGASNALLITSLIVISFVMIQTTRTIGVKFKDFFKSVYRIHLLPILLFSTSVIIFRQFFDEPYLVDLLFGTVLGSLYYIYMLYKKAIIF